MPSNVQPLPGLRRFSVFISYRHVDNTEEGRRWADEIHRFIEEYQIPPDLIGTLNSHGGKVPATLYPAFRDEKELPADSDLQAGIRRALEHSDFMLVLCTPRSATSPWVRNEVRKFKQLGKADRILAVIIAGEPNADDPHKASNGIRREEECLSHPLRYGLPMRGKRNLIGKPCIDWKARAVPNWADFRPEGTRAEGYVNPGDYKRHLTLVSGHSATVIEKLVEDYRQRVEQNRLKLLAGILGVSTGLLEDRDNHRRRQQAEREAALQKEIADRERALANQAEQAKLRAEISANEAEQAKHRAEHAAMQAHQAELRATETARLANEAAERERIAADKARNAEARAVISEDKTKIYNRVLILAIVIVFVLGAAAGWNLWQAKTQNDARKVALVRAAAIARESGIRSWRNGDWTQALRSLLQAIELQPTNSETAHLLWHALACGGGNRLDLPDRALRLPGEYRKVYFNPVQPLVMLSEPEKMLELWRYQPGWERIKIFNESEDLPNPVEWSPDGMFMILQTFRGYSPLYKLKDSQPVFMTKLGEHDRDDSLLCFVHPHRLINQQGVRLREWDFEKGRVGDASIQFPEGMNWITFHPLLPLALLTPNSVLIQEHRFERRKSVLVPVASVGPAQELSFAASKAIYSKDGRYLFVKDPGEVHPYASFVSGHLAFKHDDLRRMFTSREPATGFTLSPDEKSLLLALLDGHFEAIDSKTGACVCFFPQSLAGRFQPMDFAPLTSEVMARFGKTRQEGHGPIAFYKLPSAQSAFAETPFITPSYFSSFAWTKDRSSLIAHSHVSSDQSFWWPSLKTQENMPGDIEKFPSTTLNAYKVFLNYADEIKNPFLPEDRSKVSVESGDGRFRFQLLDKNYTASRATSMAAIPIVEVHPPGDIRRFIEPFLEWYERPDELEKLIALRDKLHAELVEDTEITNLPREWRDLLIWWTTKPGDRKPLYQQ